MKILYVEDNPNDADLAQRWLLKHAPQFVLEMVATQSEAVSRLTGPDAPPYDLVLTDLRLPDGDGLSLLTHIRERALPLAVVVITGTSDEETAVTVLKAGADDYVAKRDDYLERLPSTLEGALHRHRARAARQSRPLKVLYAEHHDTDIDLTRRHFQRHAPYIQLDVVRTGTEALRHLQQPGQASAFDAILLDYRLLGLNALEVLKELRQGRAPDIPVVLVTGQGGEEVALQALRLGAAGYLVKNPGYLYQLPGELENACYRAEIIREKAALSESEARNRAMLEAIPDLMFLQSRDGVYLDFHAKEPSALLVPPEQILGKNMREVLPLELAERFAKCFEEAESGQPYLLEYSLPILGEERHYEARVVSCNHDKVLSLVRDVTERQRAEQRLRGFFDLPLVGMAITSPERRFLVVNQKLCDLLGYPEQKLTGMTWVEVTHPDDVAENVRLLEQTLRGETDGYLMDKRFIHRDGHVVHASISTRCVRREDGAVDHLVLIVQDITERKWAEERFLKAFQSSPQPMAITTLREGRFIDINESYVNMSGYTREELISHTVLELNIWENPEARADFIALLKKQGAARNVEIKFRTKGGALRLLLASVEQIDLSGQMCTLFAVNDITERKLAEQALRESEERFHSAFDHARIGMALVATDGRFLQVNRSVCELFGYSEQELLATDFQSLTHPDDLDSNLEYSRRILAGEMHAFQMEKRYIHQRGHTVWAFLSVSLLRDGEGQPLYFISQIQDITERKRAEEALKESEDQVRLFAEHTPAAVAMFDRQMRYILTSRRWLKDYNLGEQNIIGRSHYEVFPEIPERWKEIHQRCLAGAVETCEEDYFIRPDGTTDWLQWEVRPWYSASAGIGGIIMFTEVLTERKRAEQARRESEKRYRTLFEKANDAILLETENDEILEVNQRACELFGYSREELLAMKVPDLQAPEARGRVGNVIKSELKKFQDTPFERLNLHRSGRRIPVEVTNTVVEDQGRTMVLSVVRNVTERKQLDRQRQEQINSIAESETQQYNFDRIMGRSGAIRETISAAQKVAAGDVSPVLITGETGTGKGMVARAIHYASRRAPFAFVTIDCTAIPETLFESELFGYEQGAFTDAKKSKRGHLELAKGGTLFLDEISEIPLTLQAKLLQILQEGIFHRVGGRGEIALNARVLAATNRDLRAEVAAGRFRSDLYQRLFVVQIDMPPLCEREDDILFLAEHFITVYNKKYGKSIRRIAPRAAEILRRYPWPGNVRELEHAIERAVFFEEGNEIRQQHLRIDLDAVVPAQQVAAVATPSDRSHFTNSVPKVTGTLGEMSTTIIKQTVEQCGGNISKAARTLGISRSRIYRVLEED